MSVQKLMTKARRDRAMTLAELAVNAGVRLGAVNSAVSRGDNIQLATLKKYAEAAGYRVSLKFLRIGDSPETRAADAQRVEEAEAFRSQAMRQGAIKSAARRRSPDELT